MSRVMYQMSIEATVPVMVDKMIALDRNKDKGDIIAEAVTMLAKSKNLA